ncbi:MAG: hypothetical protein JSV56_03350 [Methanomassiliicoccales archaeon]|nr:MAG: hypothetical protein JSV56_03350 [Methanomassiliicoccales archaeon]
MSLILKSSLKDEIDSWIIKINTKVATGSDIESNDICEVFNRDRGSSRYLRVKLDGRLKAGTAMINREMAQLDGAANNDQLEIMKSEPMEAEELLVRVEMETEDRKKQIKVLTEINKDQGELIHNFFRKKKPVFNQGSKIYWKEKNLNLKILKVSPFPYAAYVPGTKVKVALTSPFNGILMVDTSGSMYKQLIPNVPGTLRLSDDPILSKLTNTPKYKMLKEVIEAIENDGEVPRLYAALGAVLLYFSEKAERELSEKVGLIAYSNKARIAGYRFKGKNRYWLQVGEGGINNPEQYKEMLVRALFECIGQNTKKVTHGYNAFIEVWKLFRFMSGEGKPLPTMIVILSDGEFNGDKGSFARLADVQAVSKKVIEMVKKGFASNKKVVINAVYIGDSHSTRGKIAVQTLKEITQLTNGELIQPKQLIELAKFYENAAHSLVYDLGTMEEFEEEEEEEEVEA